MTSTLEQILNNVKSRQSGSRWGIGTAAQYVAELAPCLSGDSAICPAKAFSLASGELWAKELAGAGNRLTYCDDAMADVDRLVKSINEGGTTSLPDGAVLTFDCVLTSKSKDRDGDIIEPAGLLVDKNMPLLWQHIQLSPIGKSLGILEQSENVLRKRFAIVDTALGRDTAVLVKFGALRMSQGFKPKEFSPLSVVKGAGPNGSDLITGWHVKSGECLEGSVVSIPANSDAVITAFSRKALKTELVNAWAKSYSDARPAMVAGADLIRKNANAGNLSPASQGNQKVEIEISIKKDSGDSSDSSTGLMKPALTESGDKKKKCPKCSEFLDSTGSCPACSYVVGTDKSVSASTSIFGDFIAKAGKVLSAANLAKLKAATATLEEVIASAEPESEKSQSASTYQAAKAEMVAAVLGKSFSGSSSGSKASSELETKMLGAEDLLEGSWQWVERKLEKTAADYLRAKGIEVNEYDDYAYLTATFPNRGIVCVYGYGRNSKSTCYEMTWETNADGIPQWSGEPKEVEIKPQVMAKFAEPSKLLAKALQAECLKTGDAAPLAMLTETLEFLNEQREQREMSELFGV